MRDIKFRGKRLDDGGWVYGDLINHRNGTKNICDAEYGYGWTTDTATGFVDEVDPATVGQYTGLKDNTGREIYEGDICKGTFYHMFKEANMTFQIYWDFRVGGWQFNSYDIQSLEFVGNIHDAKEAKT